MKKELTLPVDVEMLVPHRRPMCLIDRLVAYEDRSGVVETLITPDNPLVEEDGSLDQTAYIELIAQSYAAIKGYQDLLQGKQPQKGFLVSAKKIDVPGKAFAGDLLRISASTEAEVGDFTIAEGTVRRGDEVLATGNLTLWIP